jgi:hypothetical protein
VKKPAKDDLDAAICRGHHAVGKHPRENTGSLATNPQSLDEVPISLHILTFQIVEEFPSTAHHSEQTPTGMVVLLVEGQVLA